ncbi:sugar transferase [Profundibacter sp.]
MSLYYRNISDENTLSSDTYPSQNLGAGTNPSLYRYKFKRMCDVLVVLLAAPIILPVVGLLALIVGRNGGQPFYSQQRIGRYGREYKMWKLRSMVCGADARLEKHLMANPEARAEWDATQKLKNDPRITRFGRLLRKSSMDELPQLWNVLRGEMSLVGPRPMMTSQKGLYPGRCYYELSPGITGSWQISARNGSTFADRAKFDSDYNRNLSFGGDVRILFGTVAVVLRATGY